MPDRRPIVLGITGNIACGKSLVASILQEHGAEVIDADHIAHDLMSPGSGITAEIAARFGNDVLKPDGSIDRPALGKIVFSDPEALAELERITHPAVVETILVRVAKSTAGVLVIDAIKLFESGLANHCDEVWAVFCDPEIQRSRLMERNGIDDAEADRRIRAQPPQSEKRERAHRVIDNSGGVADTREQVLAAHQRLLRSH